MASDSPPLRCVAVVCASHAAVAPLEHVVHLIDSFLDPSPRFSAAQAAATGIARLLQRVLTRLRQTQGLDRFLRELWLREAIQQAIRGGHLALVALIHEYHPGYLASSALVLAAERGDLEIIQWLLTHQPQQTAGDIPAALAAAAQSGHLQVLRFFLEDQGYAFCPSDALTNAIEHGHTHVAEYLYSRGVRCDMRAVGNTTARSGYLSMVQWLHKIDAPLTFTSEAMTSAAGAGHLDIVRFLHENRREGCRSRAMDGAATRGSIEILEFLYANQQKGCTDRAVVGAASNGHVDVLSWLYQHFPRLVSRTVAAPTVAAIANGRHDVLEWLQANLGPTPILPAYAAVEIAKARNLGGLKTLHAMHGTEIQWSPRVVAVAASNGDVVMLQWLLDHRPQTISSTAINEAAEKGEFETVQWLHVHGVECTAFTLSSAVASGLLPMVQWVSANYTGNEASAAMDGAAALGNLPIVQWLHENRSEGCTTTAMDLAAANGHLHVVIWLHEHRSEGCTTTALETAATMPHWEVAQWLVHNRTEGCTQLGMDDAVAFRHLRIAELLHDRYGLLPSADGVLAATKNGFLDVVQWIQTRQFDVDLNQCRLVAERSCQFHIVHWIDSLGRQTQPVERIT